jgi:hypothetical protein
LPDSKFSRGANKKLEKQGLRAGTTSRVGDQQGSLIFVFNPFILFPINVKSLFWVRLKGFAVKTAHSLNITMPESNTTGTV